MAWAYPTAKFPTSVILDLEDFNANVRNAASEIDGGLNEHNFGVTTLQEIVTTNADGADDIYMRAFQTFKELDPQSAIPGSHYAIPHETRWTAMPDSKVTFTVPRGRIFVLCNFQQRGAAAYTLPPQSGLNFCLELDGVPQMNSVLGTADHANDFIDDTLLEVRTGSPFVSIGSAPGFRGEYEFHSLFGNYAVAAGQHTIALSTRNLNTTTTARVQYIPQVETVVLFLWDE